MTVPQTESESTATWLPPLRPLSAAEPWRWLRAGLQDFIHAPWIGLSFGAAFAAMGWALLLVLQNAVGYLLWLSVSFLFVGPFLCMGLYQVSERLHRGQPTQLRDALMAWRGNAGALAIFGLMLLVIELLWARASLVAFALSDLRNMPKLTDLLSFLADPENLNFVGVWLALAALFTTLIFSISVISIPMMLDGHSDAVTAGLTSLRLVIDQPLVMLQWALIIAVLSLLAMLPGFAGLLLVAPILGHASWHAYRAAVDLSTRRVTTEPIPAPHESPAPK